MSDRDARTLERVYLNHLRRSLSCISRATLLAHKERSKTVTIVRTNPRPIRLRSNDHLHLEIHQEYSVGTNPNTNQLSIRLVGYRYTCNDAGGQEFLAYHHHPTGISPIKHPHIHVGTNDPRLDHGHKHLPTGLVTLEQIIRCLITEFDVTPLRPDWADILAAGRSTIDAEGSI